MVESLLIHRLSTMLLSAVDSLNHLLMSCDAPEPRNRALLMPDGTERELSKDDTTTIVNVTAPPRRVLPSYPNGTTGLSTFPSRSNKRLRRNGRDFIVAEQPLHSHSQQHHLQLLLHHNQHHQQQPQLQSDYHQCRRTWSHPSQIPASVTKSASDRSTVNLSTSSAALLRQQLRAERRVRFAPYVETVS